MTHESPGQTLQATELVHEAYLRLVGNTGERTWNGRVHFFRAAAEAMRQILVDAARRKRCVKHGGNCARVELDSAVPIAPALGVEDVVSLSDALDKLAEHAPEKAELVKLRYFGGLSVEETASLLEISRATAERHWGYAKTWLYCELTRDAGVRAR